MYLSNDSIITDNKIISDELKKYCVSICGSVENNQPIITHDAFHTYLPDKPHCSLKLKLMTVKGITDIINNLKPKSSSGVEELFHKVIKHIPEIIAEPLTINQLLNTGLFPDSLKISKVIPLFKKDNEKLFSDYRPISLLPSISKFFLNVIFMQMLDYFENNDLIF